jgi:predicted 3-demethylubiquinone-9 3-methyltransferase (glyoxalase superfamily)
MKPKQARIPGTEDAAIQELESLAEDYAEKRDKRLEVGKAEIELKGQLLAAMDKHKKKKYEHAGVSIEVTVEKRKVKVRIKKDLAAEE